MQLNNFAFDSLMISSFMFGSGFTFILFGSTFILIGSWLKYTKQIKII
jgi:hypothetical protein